jgi:type II secretory pathway component PulF
VQWQNETRLKLYYKLAALLRNRFTLMDALDRIWVIESKDGTASDEPFAIAVAWWLRELEKGLPFSSAIEGWAPMRERLMLSVGDVSKLEKALINVIKVSEGSNKIIQPLIGAVTYPLMMIALSMLIIVAVGIYMVPPLMEIAKNTKFTGTAASLVWMSEFTRKLWWTIPIGMLGIVAAIYISFANMTGKIRVFFDRMPPWSLYRMFTGVSWLMSLAALVESGTPIAKAMQSLRQNASPYLRERIDKTLTYMKNGDNLGTALKRTGMHFPEDELIGDLEIYAELDNFEDALNAVADDYLQSSIKNISSQATMLNSFALLLVSGIIAWVLLGVFDMQNQVQTAM